MKKTFIFTAFVLIFTSFFTVKASAESYALCEADCGEMLMSENGDERYNASTLAKLMTVLIAAEKIDKKELALTDIITASENVMNTGGAKIWLTGNDTISAEELLKAIIIGNANDAALTVAEKIAGSEEKFVSLMNEKAKELDMENTHYVNSHGYKSDGSFTTANDTVKLLSELSRYEFLTDYFLTRTEYIRNDTVMLVTSNPYALNKSGCIGFKTGVIDDEKLYSVQGVKKGNRVLVSAALGYKNEDEAAEKAFSLIDTGLQKFVTVNLIHPENTVTEISVNGGRKNHVGLNFDDEGKYVIKRGDDDKITYTLALPEYVYAPVNKNEKIGEIMYYYDDKLIYRAEITASKKIMNKTLGYCMVKMFKNIMSF